MELDFFLKNFDLRVDLLLMEACDFFFFSQDLIDKVFMGFLKIKDICFRWNWINPRKTLSELFNLTLWLKIMSRCSIIVLVYLCLSCSAYPCWRFSLISNRIFG